MFQLSSYCQAEFHYLDLYHPEYPGWLMVSGISLFSLYSDKWRLIYYGSTHTTFHISWDSEQDTFHIKPFPYHVLIDSTPLLLDFLSLHKGQILRTRRYSPHEA